jgi:hypothetical protein
VEGTEPPGRNDYVYVVRDEAAYFQPDDEKQEVARSFDLSAIVCQFCGMLRANTPHLFEAKHKVRNPNTDAIASVWICNECVARMAQLVAEERPVIPWLWFWREWLPSGNP